MRLAPLSTVFVLSIALVGLGCPAKPAPAPTGKPAETPPAETPPAETPPAEGTSTTDASGTSTTGATAVASTFDANAFYAASCAGCHGVNGEGVDGKGPAYAKVAHEPPEELLAAIMDGKDSKPIAMPAFKDVITEADAKALLTYIQASFIVGTPAEDAPAEGAPKG